MPMFREAQAAISTMREILTREVVDAHHRKLLDEIRLGITQPLPAPDALKIVEHRKNAGLDSWLAYNERATDVSR